jgi:hypothetical protein
MNFWNIVNWSGVSEINPLTAAPFHTPR